MKNNHFSFISPMYNASKYLQQMLSSIISQSYDDWSLILIDDCSSFEEKEKSKQIITSFQNLLLSLGKGEDKIKVFWNDENPYRGKQWEVSNVLFGINQCHDDDIICRIDADDWLTDTDALAIINACYAHTGADAIWTAHRWGFSDKNISGPMSNGVDPYQHPWVSSHLKTFKKNLLNGVKDENFRGEDGAYIRRAGDQAIYLPALFNAKNKFFLPRVMYHYTINDIPETYQTSDALFQRDEALFLRKRGYLK
jgi:glycosyltransferase involved in cell wall biosynthesis